MWGARVIECTAWVLTVEAWSTTVVQRSYRSVSGIVFLGLMSGPTELMSASLPEHSTKGPFCTGAQVAETTDTTHELKTV